eukprot:TRINITY_DN1757_c0_g1_i3.p1 TRINITY_DN1757_c0_g1~~TRINITY_DN1757_c0_g1_i3.p1  ORF type:complete len:386 (+),score=30.56 TRINITY_DN1757_c0_g1_i3:278-1435(+)
MVNFLCRFHLPIAFHGGSSFTFYRFFSTCSAGNADHDNVKDCPMFTYLRSELGLSDSQFQTAARYSPRLVRMQSTENARKLFTLFRDYGYTEDEIKKSFVGHPSIIKIRPENVNSKFEFLRSSGFTAAQLVHFVSLYPRFLTCSLEQNLAPKIRYFQRVFQGNENFVKVMKYSPSLMAMNLERQIIPKIDILWEGGVEGKFLVMLLHRHHRVLNSSTDSLRSYIEFVRSMGIEGPSNLYVNAIAALTTVGSVEKLKERFLILESFGLSKEDVANIFRKYPRAFRYSIEKTKKIMEYLVHVCKFNPDVLINHPTLLTYSLEKRIKPRYEVFKFLQRFDPDYSTGSAYWRMLKQSVEEFMSRYVVSGSHTEALLDVLEKALDDKRHD